MPKINHSLYRDFPDYRNQINQLKLESEEFSQLATQYHKLDHNVRGLEMQNIPVTDQTFEELKLKRVQLKDKLYKMISAY